MQADEFTGLEQLAAELQDEIYGGLYAYPIAAGFGGYDLADSSDTTVIHIPKNSPVTPEKLMRYLEWTQPDRLLRLLTALKRIETAVMFDGETPRPESLEELCLYVERQLKAGISFWESFQAASARVAELTGRVGELEGALGFYADDGNCNEDGAFIDHESERVTSASNPDLLDLGDRARAALGDEDA